VTHKITPMQDDQSSDFASGSKTRAGATSHGHNSRAASRFQKPILIFLFGCAGLTLLTFVCFQLNVRAALASLLYMVVVVVVSLQRRLIPAVLISLAAVTCLDYFFVEPALRLAPCRESQRRGSGRVLNDGHRDHRSPVPGTKIG
jgi:K+-sensing histidine kinase KdpD